MSDALSYVPLAIVMVAGPQIISAFFLATSKQWRSNSSAYILGAAISVTMFVALAYWAVRGLGLSTRQPEGAGVPIVDWTVIGLLVAAAVMVFVRRKNTEPPKWMRGFEDARPRRSLALGFLLLGLFPTDIMSSAVVGTRLARTDAPLYYCLPFLISTLLLLALPAFGVVLLGTKSETVLPIAREWMASHSWIVSEAVIALLIIITLS